MELKEKCIKSSLIFDGNVVKLHLDNVILSNGKEATREVIKHSGGVAIAALTDNDELLFVEQFRYPFNKVILELPAGKLEKSGTPLENGIRELEEETGATGENYVSLGVLYPTVGFCNEIIYLYFCRVTGYGVQNLDEDEFLNVKKIKIEKAVEMVMNNEIVDAKTQIAILKTHLLLKNKEI